MQAKRLSRHWIRSYLIAMAIQAASAAPVAAQTTAVLQGAVFDPSGAVVPAASVRVQHRANGTERAVVTDVRGHFEIVALATGDYRIEVQAPGFQAQIVEPFVVDTARTIVQDFHLTLGDLSQKVTVDARDPLLDRASTAVGHVLNEQFVQGIPLNGRRFVDLGFLLAGSVTPGQGGYLTAPSRGDGFYGFNTAGNREDTINFLVNGVTITEQFNGLPLLTTVSTAQELKVDNSTFSAEYGRNSG
ncbi:MAG: carboxypeptidase-like regulatory domain-containing protein, partial [Acidobacteriota bacterium]|nr:carboxypeptidase-like regulatory domain-containing protein [Acidobacteriota bacterium]